MGREAEQLYQIALTLVPGIGDTLGRTLIAYCGSAREVFRQRRGRLMHIPGIGSSIASSIASFRNFSAAETELRFIEKHKIKAMHFTDAVYPHRLKSIADAPMMLYYLGNADLNNPKIIAIVGTRKSTEYGRAFIDSMLAELAGTGALILSGLAYGIDIHAHRQAVKNCMPTVGVVAHGLDRIYPSQHKATARKMLDNGGLLTEFPSNTNPDRENFPKRNRIVAGLCDVLVVVETAVRGGAMITAEIANSYNRDVMALPGRTTDEFSGGCNALIKRNKAAIITETTDLIELMNWDLETKPSQQQPTLMPEVKEEDRGIVEFIRKRCKVGIDDLSFSLSMDAGDLSLRLLDLEFGGIIRSLPGKYYELK